MTKWLVVVAAVLGVVLGVCGVIGWEAFGPGADPDASVAERVRQDHRDYSNARNMPRTALARALFNRIAPRYVADERGSWGVYFFARPGTLSENLCRVDRVYMPAAVVRGRETKQDAEDDDLEVTTLYALWRNPGGADVDDATRTATCARYRDFDHLISGDGSDVERVINVLNAATTAANAGRVNFVAQCKDERQEPAKACDGAAYLRVLQLRDVAQVDKSEEAPVAGGLRHTDSIFLRATRTGCGREEVDTLKIVSTQTFGRQSVWEGDPTEIDIVRTVEC